jgi:hypothetical protein
MAAGVGYWGEWRRETYTVEMLRKAGDGGGGQQCAEWRREAT